MLALASVCGCAGGARDVTPPPVGVVAPVPLHTNRADVWLRTDSGWARVPHALMRLDVVGRDSAGLRVRCRHCDGPAEGYLSETDVVGPVASPSEAASGELAAFALAVRAAAAARDVAALVSVMAPDFVFDLDRGEGRLEAVAAWRRERFRALDHVPGLIDRGLVRRWASAPRIEQHDELWISPPAFAAEIDYRGYRLGFRRLAGGEWRWAYLVGGR